MTDDLVVCSIYTNVFGGCGSSLSNEYATPKDRFEIRSSDPESYDKIEVSSDAIKVAMLHGYDVPPYYGLTYFRLLSKSSLETCKKSDSGKSYLIDSTLERYCADW